jgi:alpha-L-fucosidase
MSSPKPLQAAVPLDETVRVPSRAPRWFAEARLGAEFHWGPFSAAGQGEHYCPSPQEYRATAEAWEPAAFDARAWVEAVAGAGLRYVIFPARAFDGYCLWRTATTSFCSVHSGAGRDFLGELLSAARAAGLRVGISLALADFLDETCQLGPDRAGKTAWQAYVQRVEAQLTELLTHYGPLDLVRISDLAAHGARGWNFSALTAMVRELQPEALLHCAWPGTDVAWHIRPNFQHNGPWETDALLHPPLRQQHGWRAEMEEDGHVSPVEDLIDQTLDVAAAGGNLVFHLNPDGAGLLPLPVRAALGDLGRWLEVYGEAIYGTQRVRYQAGARHTRRGRHLYLHRVDRAIWAWDRERGLYAFSGIREPVKRVWLLAAPDCRLSFEWHPGGRLLVRGLPHPGAPEWERAGGVLALRLGQREE